MENRFIDIFWYENKGKYFKNKDVNVWKMKYFEKF